MDTRMGVVSAVGVAVGVTVASYAVMSLRSHRKKKRASKSRKNRIHTKSTSSATSTRTDESRSLLKDAEMKYQIKFVGKKTLTADTKNFRFKLPNSEECLGCPVGKHVFLSAKINEKVVTRSYVPTNSANEKGFAEFVIKIYAPTAEFPQGGVFTRYLDSLKSDDVVSVHGPSGILEYNSTGHLVSEAVGVKSPQSPKMREVSYRCFAMVAGGSGITPMYQIIRAILSNPKDTTRIVLLYANREEENIILRKELDSLQDQHQDRFKVYYVVEKSLKESKLMKGQITEEMIKEKMPPAANDVAALLCGPTEMINFVCVPAIDALGYALEHTYIF